MAYFDWRHFDWSSLARGWGRDLAIAAGLFTRIPVGLEGELAPAEAAAALRAAPLIGLGIGLGGAAAYAIARLIGLGPALAALLALAVTIALSGALHEDGLADFADALGGGTTAQRLAIMRDSRLGSYGVLALLMSVALRAAALAEIAPVGKAAAALVAAAALSRGLLPLLAHLLPPAREDGLGAFFARPSREASAVSAVLGALAALVFLGPLAAALALVLALSALAATARLAQRHLGGYTGDVLGAAQQAAEVGALLAAAICA